MMPPLPRRTQMDREHDAQRAKSLKQTWQDYAAHDGKLKDDNFARLLAISDEEWQKAVDEEGEMAGG